MRLIDADRLYPDRMTNKGTVAISQSQIAKAPTINAIPISVVEDIKAELLKGYVDDNPKNYEYTIVPLKEVLEIIDKYREDQNDQQKRTPIL